MKVSSYLLSYGQGTYMLNKMKLSAILLFTYLKPCLFSIGSSQECRGEKYKLKPNFFAPDEGEFSCSVRQSFFIITEAQNLNVS